MYVEYTALVEYISSVNACEIAAGSELITITVSDDEEPLTLLQEEMERRGSYQHDYHVVNMIEGCFDDVDEFWEAQNHLDEAVADEHRQEHEEILWAQYAASNFGDDEN